MNTQIKLTLFIGLFEIRNIQNISINSMGSMHVFTMFLNYSLPYSETEYAKNSQSVVTVFIHYFCAEHGVFHAVGESTRDQLSIGTSNCRWIWDGY